MAADSPRDSLHAEGAAPSRQVAAEVGAMVAEQVRRAIESAERSARDLRVRALDSGSADREAVDRTAATVLDQIDQIEAQIGELLRGLRSEVERISDEGKRIAVPKAAAPPSQEPTAEPAPPVRDAALARPSGPPPPPARRRRRGLFGRRLGEGTVASCAVCGRNVQPGDDDLGRWAHTTDLSLCPACLAEHWRLPRGARLPYRATSRDAT